jgi:hypothetical protein
MVSPLNEVAEFGRTRHNRICNFTGGFVFVFLGLRLVPLRKASFALAVEANNEMDHRPTVTFDDTAESLSLDSSGLNEKRLGRDCVNKDDRSTEWKK